MYNSASNIHVECNLKIVTFIIRKYDKCFVILKVFIEAIRQAERRMARRERHMKSQHYPQ
jgi:hypothetical protein